MLHTSAKVCSASTSVRKWVCSDIIPLCGVAVRVTLSRDLVSLLSNAGTICHCRDCLQL
jgi:hypothetical protein